MIRTWTSVWKWEFVNIELGLNQRSSSLHEYIPCHPALYICDCNQLFPDIFHDQGSKLSNNAIQGKGDIDTKRTMTSANAYDKTTNFLATAFYADK